jgi:hypothetical protein
MNAIDLIPPALMTALSQLLRPLVRMLLNFNVTHPVLCGVLKSLYVEVAEREFPVPGKQQSDSRITLLTGIHRKEVRRLRQHMPEPAVSSANATLGAQLVARWTGLPEFLDDDGHPLPLPRLARDNDQPSFEKLVQTQSKDIRPRVVLDEWLRLGVAHLDTQDRVWLNTEAFVPDRGLDEKSWFMGRNLHDHIAACAHNIAGVGPPLMERSVFYDSLTEKDVAELETMARQVGMQALQLINRKAMELQNRSDGKPDAIRRINFGLYFFHAPDDAHAAGKSNDDDNAA